MIVDMFSCFDTIHNIGLCVADEQMDKWPYIAYTATPQKVYH